MTSPEVHAVAIHYHFWWFQDALISEHLASLVLFKSMSYRTVNDSHWKHRWCSLGLFYASQQHTVQVSLYDCDIFHQCQQKNQTTHFQCQFWPVLGRCAQCMGQKGTSISELHWIYERKLQDKSSFPVKTPFLTPDTRGLTTIKLWI